MSSPPFSTTTSSGNGAKRCNISVDGESFDITNLLEELPTTTSSSDGHDHDDKRDALKKNYPSIGKLLAQSSHHKLRASFLGREDSFVFPTSSSHHQTGVPGLSELNESMSSFSESHGFLEGSSWHNNTTTTCSDDDRKMPANEIEVSPGVFLPFRGSDETWRAIRDGKHCCVVCFDCSLELVAARDCAHVVCPECHTVNPLSLDHHSSGSQHFGVLMGFKKQWCGEYFKDETTGG
ncbi:expressed unknown protein [Seminavis robusta]|uniref:Uncharacterized protein n=1 Tax=Seminavis robusta TaxID=568900 RepID=A0A9N8D985_9STRA|nr:expressed unknown protein [Seminavis robusta]|eukprot:Sro44_g026760.1 n/a (236) ;mRNA; f:147102-147809